MAFSSENDILFADDMLFEDFLKEQTRNLEESISSARHEFIIDANRYFSCEHALSEQQLAERREKVSLFFDSTAKFRM